MDENTAAGAPQGENNDVPKQEEMKTQVVGFVAKVEAWLDTYMVTKAPFQIPLAGKEVIVKVAPYFIIVFSVLALPAILALLGITAVFAPMAALGGGMSYGFFGLIGVLSSIVSLVLDVMAIPGLFKRAHSSWRLLFYATLVSFVGGVLSMNPIGAVIGAIISWYILFQVKELYKN